MVTVFPLIVPLGTITFVGGVTHGAPSDSHHFVGGTDCALAGKAMPASKRIARDSFFIVFYELGLVEVFALPTRFRCRRLFHAEQHGVRLKAVRLRLLQVLLSPNASAEQLHCGLLLIGGHRLIARTIEQLLPVFIHPAFDALLALAEDGFGFAFLRLNFAGKDTLPHSLACDAADFFRPGCRSRVKRVNDIRVFRFNRPTGRRFLFRERLAPHRNFRLHFVFHCRAKSRQSFLLQNCSRFQH